MKSYIYLLGLICSLLGASACGGGDEPDFSETRDVSEHAITELAPIRRVIPTVVDTIITTVVDTIVDVPINSMEGDSSSEEARTEMIERVVELTNELKAVYEIMEDKQERYVEGLPLGSFLGMDIDMIELEISQVTPSFLRVHADYFDGEPIGGKRFFVKDGELLGVEVVQLEEKTTENGTQVIEEIRYMFYYNEERLLQVWDNKEQKELEPSALAWMNENLEDWKLIKEKL